MNFTIYNAKIFKYNCIIYITHLFSEWLFPEAVLIKFFYPGDEYFVLETKEFVHYVRYLPRINTCK